LSTGGTPCGTVEGDDQLNAILDSLTVAQQQRLAELVAMRQHHA